MKKQLQDLGSYDVAIFCQPGPSDAAVDLAWSYSRGVTLAAEKHGSMAIATADASRKCQHTTSSISL